MGRHTLAARVTAVLLKCYRSPFSTKSNTAREYTNEVAAAASMGLLTSYVPTVGFSNTWYLTNNGLKEIHKE